MKILQSALKHVCKMTKAERQRRIEKIQSEAALAVRKSEQLNFRLEPELIGKLGDLAIKKRIPLGTMVRNWVVERLEQETTQQAKAIEYVRKSSPTYSTDGLLKRVQILEAESERQKDILSNLQKGSKKKQKNS